jgi:small subunit ribosomal protein S10|uniref:Small ribosomal subunit protein uS10c n=2 Tax=Cyanidioschyzon merolae TaxID=45157 RepID=Q85FT6_CYAM1|nr:ribosomal protein S10 [Cyanidioschyzon merolae strain 10D]QFV17047.1 30S ribosomal protein S10 [Cyanidioschyzon merolae]QFV17220.1 30S ribosomal protein S10 [Cyanidioschyzon merolae]BAC76259.1 30S ribosomal protein S10 [Cyanidioschyzon merolae strain 10D]
MKIRLKFYSYSAQLVQSSLDQMAQIASQTAQVSKVCLPTKRKIFCVLRSPHVNKDSREHFEIRIHRRLLELKNASAATIDALMKVDLAYGVEVEIQQA